MFNQHYIHIPVMLIEHARPSYYCMESILFLILTPVSLSFILLLAHRLTPLVKLLLLLIVVKNVIIPKRAVRISGFVPTVEN